SDTIPDGWETFANYKRIEVTVRRAGTGTVAAQLDSILAPPTQPSLIHAKAKLAVIDAALLTPVAGASVTLSGGPSGTRTGVSGADGTVTFPALSATNTAMPHYEV